MKCDELKYEKLGDMMLFYPRSTLVIRKQFVDASIAELKDKCQMHDFFWKGCGFAKRGFNNIIAVSEAFDKLEAENAELKAKLESVQASAYTDSVDAGMENRRLQRALWLARASEASKEVNYWTCQDESSYAIVDFNVHHETIVSYKAPYHRPYKWILIWENVERKCRAKAEEYK